MQVAELSGLSLLRPIRLNPHLAMAREHAKAWAREMGMLEAGGVWDEMGFDSADYALFTSHSHPDATPDDLALVTDWYVWLFFLDDQFLETYMRPQDFVGGKVYLSRLTEFIPEESGGAVPIPVDPVERGLSDLWSRTANSMSTDWCRRFRESTQGVFDEHRHELALFIGREIPDPISYLDLRRQGRGGPWAAELVELAVGATLPATISRTQPMRSLEDTFGDVLRLHNDITSYRREVEQEGEVSNQVLVVERFLGCSTGKAIAIVNDLLTSRLRRFADIVVTELPVLFAEHGLGAAGRAAVLRYVQGLHDFIAGDVHWHERSRRNTTGGSGGGEVVSTLLGGPTGLGTSATRLGRREDSAQPAPPVRSGGETVRPKRLAGAAAEYTQLDTWWDRAAHYAVSWARRIGMLEPIFGVWSEQDLTGLDVTPVRALLAPAASNQPAVSGPVRELAAAWYVWSRFADEYFFRRYVNSRDLIGATAFLARLSAFMPQCATEAVLGSANPMERGLAELWSHSLSVSSVQWRDQLRTRLPGFFDGLLRQVNDLIDSRVPIADDVGDSLRRAWSSYLLDELAGLQAAPEIQRAQVTLPDGDDLIEAPVCTWLDRVRSIQFRLPTDEFSEVSVRERVAMLTARVAQCFDDRGAFQEACDSRVTESTMMLALLRREHSHHGVQETLQRFLRDRSNDPCLTTLERRLAQISLGQAPAAADSAALLDEFDHFTADRKRLILGTYLAVLGGGPYPELDVATIGYHGYATWVEVVLCAVKVLNAYGRKRPGLVTDQDHAFLTRRLREGRRDVWEGNVGAHLMALLALSDLTPGSQLIRDGIDAIIATRNPDGGLPFIPDYTCFLGGVGALALAKVDADPVLLNRIGDYLVRQQAEDGSWPFTERVCQTDVEGGGVVVEVLRVVGPARYRDALLRGVNYLTGMANPDGGFPTYLRGHPSEVVMTANAVIALAPDWSRYRHVLEPAVEYLLRAQQPDGTYERSWSLSEAYAIRRVLHALHCVPEHSRLRFQQGISQAYALAGSYLRNSQNPEGGWGQRAGDDSDPISTAHSLSAAAVLGRPAWYRQGLGYLLRQQRYDGGFTSIPDQVAPRPVPYNFPSMANIFVLTALGDLVRLGQLSPGA